MSDLIQTKALLDGDPTEHEERELDELHAHAERVLVRGTNAEVNKAYEDILDDVYYSKTAHEGESPDTVENDKLIRAERMFCDGVQKALSDVLRSRGMYCRGVVPVNEQLRVYATDSRGRSFDVEYQLDDILALEASRPNSDEFFRGVVGHLVEALLAARERYMARMQ